MGPRPLDQLSPESRAVLSLVLLQSRSYGDIASLLRLGEDDVRQRAHVAAEGLVPRDGGVGADVRARIIDYLLGEQTVSARAQTRSELQASEAARAWAEQLAEALAPLVKSPLPSIPEPPPARPAPEREKGDKDNRPVKPAEPIPQFVPAVPPPRRRELPRGRLATAGGVAAVAIVALVIVLATSGGGGSKPSSTASTPPAPAAIINAGHSARTVEKLVLQAVGTNRTAFGAGAVVRENGMLLLLMQARGLAANTHQNAYAVWLVNTPTDARLLGFVKPAVGASGTFSSSASLPSDAFRFHAVEVTLEQTEQPTSPGPVVLRSSLSLP